VERKVFIDRTFTALDCAFDQLVGFGDLARLRGAAALRGKTCGFDFDAGAQLHDLQHFLQRMQILQFDAERAPRIVGDKGANALAHHDQPVGAQAGDGLAHDGAAHAGRRHHFFLGRQPRARQQAAAGNIAGDLRHELLGQTARRGERPECRERLVCSFPGQA
jgi:hypothetical protein